MAFSTLYRMQETTNQEDYALFLSLLFVSFVLPPASFVVSLHFIARSHKDKKLVDIIAVLAIVEMLCSAF